MAGEEDVTFTLAPNITYQAKESLTERKFKGEHEERLVKWVLDEPVGKLTDQQKAEVKYAAKEFRMWMRKDEIKSCCPSLLNAKPSIPAPEPSSTGVEPCLLPSGKLVGPQPQPTPPSVSLETDETLNEMKEDVRLLITRIKKVLLQGGMGAKVLSSTVSVLSAYAKERAMCSAFQECGAIDILLSLLSSPDHDVRVNASQMLHSLTTFDLSTRSYVLLYLVKGESGAEASLQSRQMLLDMFSETASVIDSELKGVTFPLVRQNMFLKLTTITNTTIFLNSLLNSPFRKTISCPL